MATKKETIPLPYTDSTIIKAGVYLGCGFWISTMIISLVMFFGSVALYVIAILIGIDF